MRILYTSSIIAIKNRWKEFWGSGQWGRKTIKVTHDLMTTNRKTNPVNDEMITYIKFHCNPIFGSLIKSRDEEFWLSSPPERGK